MTPVCGPNVFTPMMLTLGDPRRTRRAAHGGNESGRQAGIPRQRRAIRHFLVTESEA